MWIRSGSDAKKFRSGLLHKIQTGFSQVFSQPIEHLMSNRIRDTMYRRRRNFHSDIDHSVHPGAVNLFISMCSRGQGVQNRRAKRRWLRISKVKTMRTKNIRAMRTRSAVGLIANHKPDDEE